MPTSRITVKYLPFVGDVQPPSQLKKEETGTMFSPALTVHEGLENSRRLGALSGSDRRAVTVVEFGTLLLLGASAAVLSAFLKRGTGIPGSNIILVVFPMAFGLALVPRHGAASVMGFSAMGSAGVFCFVGTAAIGCGALTSLALTGILIDVALRGAQSGRGIYARLMLAGLSANMAAFLIRAGAKILLGPGHSGKPLALWWQYAIVTYAVCGLLAGAISAAVWFRFAARNKANPTGGAAS